MPACSLQLQPEVELDDHVAAELENDAVARKHNRLATKKDARAMCRPRDGVRGLQRSGGDLALLTVGYRHDVTCQGERCQELARDVPATLQPVDYHRAIVAR